MLFVYITDTCREDAKRHSMVSNLERLVKEIEKTQTTSAFDQFPKPYYVKKKFAGRQGRLIAAEKFVKVKGETHSVLALLAILIRGDGEYDSPTGFGHDPEGYGKKYLMPEFEALDFEAIVEERMQTEPPPQKDKLHDLEQMFLANDQRPGAASNEMMLCESKKWVDEVVKCEDLLPRLKDQILEISSLGCDESVDGVHQKTPVLQREDYEIAYQWLEGGRRLFLYDLVKQGVEPDGAIPRNRTEDIQKYLYREYPDWMLYDDKMWNDLEKDRFGNFSLSPEESRILHPTNSDGLQFPLFINGRAGSGKSTVLQYLYADYFSRYAKVGKEAGKPPAYFTCNRELIRSAVDLVKSKHVLVDHGRPIHISQDDTQFLCYAICDFTNPIREWAEENDYAKMHGEFAYYYYNRNLNASIYLVNLDQIAIDARKRNFAFFDRLGIKCD